MGLESDHQSRTSLEFLFNSCATFRACIFTDFIELSTDCCCQFTHQLWPVAILRLQSFCFHFLFLFEFSSPALYLPPPPAETVLVERCWWMRVPEWPNYNLPIVTVPHFFEPYLACDYIYSYKAWFIVEPENEALEFFIHYKKHSFMLSCLPCFPTFWYSAIATSCYICSFYVNSIPVYKFIHQLIFLPVMSLSQPSRQAVRFSTSKNVLPCTYTKVSVWVSVVEIHGESRLSDSMQPLNLALPIQLMDGSV